MGRTTIAKRMLSDQPSDPAMNCLATSSPKSASIGARSEKRLLLKSLPFASADPMGRQAAKTTPLKIPRAI